MASRMIMTGASILFIATGFALAGESRHDRTIEMAAAKIAAQKLGEIRASISHDMRPFMVTAELLEKERKETSLLPRPAWVPPEGSKSLPPMVSNEQSELDYTLTGSIKDKSAKNQSRIIWEKFDRYGNPIE